MQRKIIWDLNVYFYAKFYNCSTMKDILEITKTSRNIVSKFIQGYSLEQLNKVPAGFNNNLIWNIGHIVVTQQLLVYKLAGLPMMVSDELVERYKKGTKTEHQATQEEVDESNNVFSTTFGNVIQYPAQEDVFKKVKRTYTELAKTNIIAKYNSSRWYHAPSESTYQNIQNLERGYKMT